MQRKLDRISGKVHFSQNFGTLISVYFIINNVIITV